LLLTAITFSLNGLAILNEAIDVPVPGNRVIVNAESSSTNSNTMWYELELELNPGPSCMTLQRFTAVLANVDNLGSNITTPASSIQHSAFQLRVAPNVPTLHPHPI
jgi:hypothetical protein